MSLDLATHGDVNGLTKLEVIIALEELIEEKGLQKEALAKIVSFAEANNPTFCDICCKLEIAPELLVAGDRCECNDE